MKNPILSTIILLTICPYIFSMNFYVATDGSDSSPGTKARPFATIQKARDAIRNFRKDNALPKEGITVWLKGRTYKLKETIEFNKSDSGTKESRIVYSGEPNESIIFEGGVTIDSSKFKPISNPDILSRIISKEAKKKVMKVDLKTQGITKFGKIEPRGFGIYNLYSWPELIFDGEPMQLAQWPNKGFVKVAGVPDANNDKAFIYDGNRPKLWKKADDIWALGFWKWGWAEFLVKLGKIDIEKKTISILSNYRYGLTEEGLWRAINLLEEIDIPGEWFLDRKEGILYFWPPEDLKGKKIELTYFDKPVMVLKKVSNVSIRGITFRNCRGSGIEITDGKNVTIEGCTLENMGARNISINDGENNGIVSCNIYNCAADGIWIEGGDRSKLIPCNHYAINNHIYNFGRLSRTYKPALQLYGVSIRAEHNFIHDAPHSAIIYWGNNHLIQYNEIYNVCNESDDCGAIYSGRDWGGRGHIIKHNFVHNIESSFPGKDELGAHAVYLDDCLCGNTVYGNVLYKVSGRAVMNGGGRDHIIENNIIAKCSSAIFTDRRGVAWIGVRFNPTKRIEKYDYKKPPWSTAYPKLAKIMDNGLEQAKEPEGNIVRNNIGWKNERWLEENPLGGSGGFKFFTFENNIEDCDPLFVDEENLNLSLQNDSAAYTIEGFKKIPFEKIGLYRDNFRKVLPGRNCQ